MHREFIFSHIYIISYSQASNANLYHPFTSLFGERLTSELCRRYRYRGYYYCCHNFI